MKENNNLKAWLTCISAGLFFSFGMFQATQFNVLAENLIESFKLQPTTLGYLAASFGISTALFLLPAGMILDRFSIRKTLLAFAAIMVISSVLASLTTNFTFFVICRILIGISQAFASLGGGRLVVEWFPPKKNASVIGILITITLAGGIAAQFPFAYAIQAMNWRSAAFIFALSGIIMYVFMLFFLKDNNKKTEGSTPKLLLIVKALKEKQNWLLGFYVSLINLPLAILGSLWGAYNLEHSFSLTPAQSSLITMMIFVGMVIGAPCIGFLSDKLSARRDLLIMASLLMALLFIPVIILEVDWRVLLLIFLLIGFFSGAQTLCSALVLEINPAQVVGVALALLSIVANLSGSFFQPLYGAWLAKVFDASNLSNKLTFAFFPLAFILNFLLALWIKETHCEKVSVDR